MIDTPNESRPRMKTAIIMVSTAVTFLQLCGIVLYPVFTSRCSSAKKIAILVKWWRQNWTDDDSIANSQYAGYRDSILNSQPLLPTC